MHSNRPDTYSRREWLAGTVAAGLTVAAGAAYSDTTMEPFRYCLNTATIMGQKLSLAEQVEVTARAGYTGIEPWVRDLAAYADGGGDLKDIAKRIRDLGLAVESAIGFCEWAVDNDARRHKALEQARHEMELVARIGGKRIAAPPAGATDRADLDLFKVAERYRALLDIGTNFGVVAQVEHWGFSRALRRVGEALLVAVESGHPQACVLTDVYHLYKGGSGYGWVRMVAPSALGVVHVNDHPAKPRPDITDADRVWPGDGVAPLAAFFRDLHGSGFRGPLSVELFNKEYWRQDALQAARTGLDKLRAVVRQAIPAKP
jgi:sugar phosphate isomerase/epimerase